MDVKCLLDNVGDPDGAIRGQLQHPADAAAVCSEIFCDDIFQRAVHQLIQIKKACAFPKRAAVFDIALTYSPMV